MTQKSLESEAWIELRPSNVNLVLTLMASLSALGLLFLIDVPEWMRAAIVIVLLGGAVADVYFVRMRHARAVVAFRLTQIDQQSSPRAIIDDNASADAASARQGLGIQLRYRDSWVTAPESEVEAEAEGVVLPRCYVSTYFTSIAYSLPDDPGWRRWFPRVLPLWADGIDAESFRQVRVRLKWR
ncbi:MAG: hypothetical protein ACK53F_03705 [Betaproteobacteria bacterium]